MAWKSKKFKVVKIGGSIAEKALEVQYGEFDSYEEAENNLKTISPEKIEHYTILPIYRFEPEGE